MRPSIVIPSSPSTAYLPSILLSCYEKNTLNNLQSLFEIPLEPVNLLLNISISGSSLDQYVITPSFSEISSPEKDIESMIKDLTCLSNKTSTIFKNYSEIETNQVYYTTLLLLKICDSLSITLPVIDLLLAYSKLQNGPALIASLIINFYQPDSESLMETLLQFMPLLPVNLEAVFQSSFIGVCKENTEFIDPFVQSMFDASKLPSTILSLYSLNKALEFSDYSHAFLQIYESNMIPSDSLKHSFSTHIDYYSQLVNSNISKIPPSAFMVLSGIMGVSNVQIDPGLIPKLVSCLKYFQDERYYEPIIGFLLVYLANSSSDPLEKKNCTELLQQLLFKDCGLFSFQVVVYLVIDDMLALNLAIRDNLNMKFKAISNSQVLKTLSINDKFDQKLIDKFLSVSIDMNSNASDSLYSLMNIVLVKKTVVDSIDSWTLILKILELSTKNHPSTHIFGLFKTCVERLFESTFLYDYNNLIEFLKPREISLSHVYSLFILFSINHEYSDRKEKGLNIPSTISYLSQEITDYIPIQKIMKFAKSNNLYDDLYPHYQTQFPWLTISTFTSNSNTNQKTIQLDMKNISYNSLSSLDISHLLSEFLHLELDSIKITHIDVLMKLAPFINSELNKSFLEAWSRFESFEAYNVWMKTIRLFESPTITLIKLTRTPNLILESIDKWIDLPILPCILKILEFLLIKSRHYFTNFPEVLIQGVPQTHLSDTVEIYTAQVLAHHIDKPEIIIFLKQYFKTRVFLRPLVHLVFEPNKIALAVSSNILDESFVYIHDIISIDLNIGLRMCISWYRNKKTPKSLSICRQYFTKMNEIIQRERNEVIADIGDCMELLQIVPSGNDHILFEQV